jgi:hypothetical protein
MSALAALEIAGVECRGCVIFPIQPEKQALLPVSSLRGGGRWDMSGDPMEIESNFQR